MTYVSYGILRDETPKVPRTQPRTYQASSLNPLLSSQTGTKNAEECSARGHCNRQTGHCMCYSKFRSSDGRRGEGDLGDCGYFDPLDAPVDCAMAVPVWGTNSALCSGERAWCGCKKWSKWCTTLNLHTLLDLYPLPRWIPAEQPDWQCSSGSARA